MFAYAAAEFGCVGSLGRPGYFGISLVAWLILLLTAATASIAATSTFVAYRLYRHLATTPHDSADGESHSAERYISYVGLLAGSLFVFVILFESIPIFFYLRHC